MISIEEIKKIADSVDKEKAAQEVFEWVCRNVDTYIDNHNKEFVVGFSSIGLDYAPELQKVEQAFIDLNISDSEFSVESNSLDLLAGKFSEEEIEMANKVIESYKSGHLIEEETMEKVKKMLRSLEAPSEQLDSENQEIIDEESEKLGILYGLIDSIKEVIVNDKDSLERVFEKLIYYYELCGFREGQKVERELDGYAKIDEFQFYPYDLPVSSTAKIPRLDEEGNVMLDENGNAIVDIGESVVKREPPQFHVDISIDFWEKKPQMSMF